MALKGHTLIELKNVVTGEIERIEDDNMFTSALNEIYNKPPFWLVNPTIRNINVDTITNQFTPVAGTSLGGLLLFPQTIDEDTNNIFAPASNKPTGIASFDGYGGSDSRRGSFNEIESGQITGGYRFVWDFLTSQANGPIACASLTSKLGGASYFEGGTDIIKDYSSEDRYPNGAYRAIDIGFYSNIIGTDNRGIYLTKSDGLDVFRLNNPEHKLNLFYNSIAGEVVGTAERPCYVQLGTIERNGTKAIVGNELWVIVNSGNASGNATVNIDKYNLDTFAKTTNTYTIAAPLHRSASYWHTCVVKNYLYLLGYDNVSVFKINMNNVADVEKIESVFEASPSSETSSFGFIPFNNGILCQKAIIHEDNTFDRFNLACVPISVNGTWLVNANVSRNYLYIGATVITPYLATINNLDQQFIKTAQQTMKVTYTVTEV